MSGRKDEYQVDPATDKVSIHPRAGLLQRSQPTADSETAITNLHAKLAVATVLYEQHGDRRVGVFRAIVDLMDYLESQGVPRAAMEPLQAVSAAIIDADRGITHPIFRGDAKVGAPPKPVLQTNFEEQLAVVAECCVRHLKAQGVRPYLEPATKMAASMVNKSGLGIQVTATQMREIRERVRQLKSGNFGRQSFDLLLNSPAATLHPLEYARAWLASDLVTVPR